MRKTYSMVSYLNATGTQHLITKLLDAVYPVGSIYITTDDTSPASFLGGEWERYAQGRTLVGVADNETSEKTGGSERHQHNYGVITGEYYGFTAFTAQNSLTPAVGPIIFNDDNSTKIAIWSRESEGLAYGSSMANGGKAEVHSMARYRAIGTTTNSSSYPPYITVYMWKRRG